MLEKYPIYTGIPVTDLEASTKWYCDTLGLAVAADPPLEASSQGLFLDAGDDTHFFLYRTYDHPGSGATVAEFAVGDDIDSVVDGLRRRGLTFEEYDFPGLKTENGIASVTGEDGKGAHRVAFFKDPDGNVLAIGSYR